MKSVEVRTKTLEDFEYEILHHKWKNRKKPPLKLFFGYLKRSEQQIESEKALIKKSFTGLE